MGVRTSVSRFGGRKLSSTKSSTIESGRPEKVGNVVVQSVFPAPTRMALDEFYGKHELGKDGLPTWEWEMNNLTTIGVPYKMVLSWDKGVEVKKIRCHKKVAESLTKVLKALLAEFGESGLIKHGLHLYGGCYNFRPMRGSTSTLSTHAWGAAIDLNPDENGLYVKWPSKATMPVKAVNVFEQFGWASGARMWGRDAMHFQATKG